MSNLLHAEIDYESTKTSFGTWKRYLYGSGLLYREFVSDARFGSWPLVHIVSGRSPETGRTGTARGVVAIGRKAIGLIAIGQAAVGVLAVGQAAFGFIAVGQLGVGCLFGLGQAAVGFIAIGQIAAGAFCFGQFAAGLWSFGQFSHGPDLLEFLRR